MTEDAESSRSPDDYAQSGQWDIEPLYYNFPVRSEKSKRGKAYRDRADGELRCFEAHDGVKYKLGDHVYVESGSNEPFIVGVLNLFRMNKRESLSVKVTRFFRPDEVPEVSLSLILQERSELSEHITDPPENVNYTHAREVFSSESFFHYPIASLRGKCDVAYVKDFRSLEGCDLIKENSFFTCLTYNPDSSRLASVQGEIRVGASYQAKLPAEASCSVADEPDRDELIYRPGQIEESIESKYIHLARSFRMFSMLDQKPTSVEKNARVSDLLFDDSISTLHRCGYRFDEALNEMNANDKFLACSNFMTPDDIKKFGKGIRTIGKNFIRINRELLPMHKRDQLVAFYYLWKKSTDAAKPKPLARQRNQAVSSIKKTKNGQSKTSRPGSTEMNDFLSASEDETEGENKTIVKYACHHCYSDKSRDWHHAGRDGMMMCTDCRMFFKRYGTLRPVERGATMPPCLFKRSPSGTDQEEEGVRTRAGKHGRRRTPSLGDERRSPSQAVSIHEFDMEKTSKHHKNGKRKRSHMNGVAKKKKLADGEKEEESGKEDDVKGSVSPVPKGDTNGTVAQFPEDVPQDAETNTKIEIPDEEPIPVDPEQPSTSSGESSVNGSILVTNKDDDDTDDALYDENEDNTWEAGTAEVFSSTNSIFVQSIVRKVGHRCSRTDLTWKLKPGCDLDLRRKAKAEERSRVLPATPVQAKKPDTIEVLRTPVNGMQVPPAFMMDPNMGGMGIQHSMQLAMMMQHIQQQAVAHQQQQELIQQNMMKMEMQRHAAAQQQQQQQQAQLMQQQQQRENAARMSMMQPFMDQRMAQFMQPQPQNANDMRMLEQMMHQSMQSQMNPAMMAHGLPLEVQQLLMNQQAAQVMQQQMMAAAPMAAMAQMGMHGMPNMSNSDMMRRLQQEGHQAMRHQQ